MGRRPGAHGKGGFPRLQAAEETSRVLRLLDRNGDAAEVIRDALRECGDEHLDWRVRLEIELAHALRGMGETETALAHARTAQELSARTKVSGAAIAALGNLVRELQPHDHGPHDHGPHDHGPHDHGPHD